MPAAIPAMHTYQHTQIGSVIIAAAVGAIAAMLYAEPPGPGLAVALLVIGATLLLFPTLTARVSSGAVDVYFGLGLIRRRVELSEIQDVRVVRNPWYCGWGIRWIGGGWLWNVSGWRAVELELGNGRRLRIGTDQPEALADAIRQGITEENRGLR